MKLQLRSSKIKVSIVLTCIMVLVALVEVYLAYVYLYPNLNVSEDSVTTRDIVRVDLKSYEQTIDMLDGLQNFQPSLSRLTRPNPFR